MGGQFKYYYTLQDDMAKVIQDRCDCNQNTRKIKFLFSDSFGNQYLFSVIAKKIET